MMEPPRILIAGIGNIFLGDDAFGVEVAQRLARSPQPEGVRVVDFGIRGLDLAYALLDGYEAVILVDAAPRGGRPGTLYTLDLTGAEQAEAEGVPPVEAHGMDPVKVLRLAAAMGGRVQRLLLVGCEPTTSGECDDPEPVMCEAVRAAVDDAAMLVESLARRLHDGEAIEATGEATITGKEVNTCWD
jgi:hydrogenase maturation protease